MDRKLILDFDKKQKQQKSKRHHHEHRTSEKKEKKLKRDQESSTPSSATQYRDRAKERRDGLTDFLLEPEDLLVSNPIVDAETQQVDEAERRRQQIEESKYLGGDIEHTHLVKGLDFALYEKRKKDLTADEAKQRKDRRYDDNDLILAGSDSDEEQFTREALKAATATTSNKRQIDIDKLRNSDMIQCRTALARRILNALEEDKQNKSELFQAGRMTYVLSLDEESDSQVTTLVKSKAEHAESETPVSEKDLAFDQLIKIFSTKSASTSMSYQKRKLS